MKVYVRGKRVEFEPSRLLGAGGEAEVFDIDHGLALKLFKGPAHPDFAGQSATQKQVELRLDEHQRKLAAFPAGLPERVIAPQELARSRARGGRVVGYIMRRIDGAEALQRFSDPRFRRTRAAAPVAVSALCDLRQTVDALHRAGVVIGDFNDLNVLVANARAYLIDADSVQFAGYPCRMYTDNFVDPLRCAAGEVPLTLVASHDIGSDWYAFAVMVFRSLLCVDPYGGVHRPADPASGAPLSPGRRRLERRWVLDPEVVYPRPAVPAEVLPDELMHYFEGVFCRDERRPMPAPLLESLRWTRCLHCHREHARLLCPRCVGGRQASTRARLMVRGSVTAERVARVDGVIVDARVVGGAVRWLSWDGAHLCNHAGAVVASVAPAPARRLMVCGEHALVAEGAHVTTTGPRPASYLVDVVPGAGAAVAVRGERVYRVVGGALVRDGLFGEESIGRGLARQTRLWVGERFGVGWYRAGAMTVGLVFDAERAGVTEVMGLPPARGQLIGATCAVGERLAWLTTVEHVGGREQASCVALDARGQLRGAAEGPVADVPWLANAAGACAVGEQLFVPTDDGLVRVEIDGTSLVVTRAFPDTAAFVDSASRLLVARDGLHVVGRNHITRLTLSSNGGAHHDA